VVWAVAVSLPLTAWLIFPTIRGARYRALAYGRAVCWALRGRDGRGAGVRRRRLIAALGAGVLGGVAAGPFPARGAEVLRGCYGEPGRIVCTTGFARTPEIAVQPCRAHAWATCLSYLLAGFGARLDPAAILARRGLAPGCTVPARPDADAGYAHLAASAGRWRDAENRAFLLKITELADFSPRYSRGPAFADLLARLGRQPVLCGAAGHATVVTEITTQASLGGWVRRDAVTVRDPYAPSHGLRRLTAAELAQPSYVVGISIRPL